MEWTKERLAIAAGQRICVGFTGTEVIPELREVIKQHKVGNILLFSRNVKSFDQLRALCAELNELVLAETGLPPFLMIDEECGIISRIGHLTGDTPCAGALGATGAPENARLIGRMIGKRLRAAGLNMDLAPVLDCRSQPRVALGNRCFSQIPEQVARFGRAYIEGIRESGVLTCGKHFPGHGDTTVDSHYSLPWVRKSREAIEQTELVSFREAIRAGTDAIMSAHIVFPALEPDGLPATVSSRVLRGLLREQMGFSGLIISDGMEMRAMLDLFPLPEGVFRALKAGVDIALVCHEPALAAESCLRIHKGVESGELPLDNLEEAYQRIVSRKSSLPAIGPAEDFLNPQDRKISAELMRQAVHLVHSPDGQPLPAIGSQTLFMARRSRRPSPAMDSGFLNAAEICAHWFGSSLCFSDSEAIPEKPPETAMFFLEAGEYLDQDLAKAARLADQGSRVICVALDTPAVLENAPMNAWHILAWQYQMLALDAVRSMLNT